MKLLNLKKNIFKKILYLLPLSFLFNFPSHAELKIVEFENPDVLVSNILEEASKTMGKRVGAKDVKWMWGKEEYRCNNYDFTRGVICLAENLKNNKFDLAFTTAHEYAHHVQWTAFNLPKTDNWREIINIVKLELQADCFAGIILGSIQNFYINPNDSTKMMELVGKFGDKKYDDLDHHGSSENRSLALRSGLKFGSSKGIIKDNYYKVFCEVDVFR